MSHDFRYSFTPIRVGPCHAEEPDLLHGPRRSRGPCVPRACPHAWNGCRPRGTGRCTRTRQPSGPTSAFQTDTPYVVAMVELEEGVRLITQIVGCASDHVRVGMAVSVTFEAMSPEISLPKFEPAGASTPPPRPR